MITHCVMFRWKDGTSPEQVQALIDGIGSFTGEIPWIRSIRYGRDAGLAEGNYDFAVVVQLDDADAYLSYAKHPAHLKFIDECVAPIRESRVAVQFESD